MSNLVRFENLIDFKPELIEVPELDMHFYLKPLSTKELRFYMSQEANLDHTELLVEQLACDEHGNKLFTVEQLQEIPLKSLMAIAKAIGEKCCPTENPPCPPTK